MFAHWLQDPVLDTNAANGGKTYEKYGQTFPLEAIDGTRRILSAAASWKDTLEVRMMTSLIFGCELSGTGLNIFAFRFSSLLLCDGKQAFLIWVLWDSSMEQGSEW